MTDDELQSLITLLRHARTDLAGVEVKRATNTMPDSLVETLSAFSNTAGGVIILGLDENTGFAAVGIADPPTMQAKVAGLCVDSMQPPLHPLIELHEFEGVMLLTVEVPELSRGDKPAFYRGAGPEQGSYERTADGDRKLSHYAVAQLIANRGEPTDDRDPVIDATPEDLDPALVAALAQRVRVGSRTYADQDDMTVLQRLRVLTRSPEDPAALVPTVAGLLCLGRYPQDFFPQLHVSFAHLPTVEQQQDGVRLLDSKAFNGPIPVMVRDTLAALTTTMARRSTLQGASRIDHWEYPAAALREALVNALAHRDYSSAARGAQVQVEMHPDRVVIRNPGGLFGPVTLDSLGEPGVSSSRNATLFRLLQDTPLPDGGPVCENLGSGIPVMVRELRAIGLPPPRFADSPVRFEVTFLNHTLLDPEALAWVGRVAPEGLSISQTEALVELRRGAWFTNRDYRNRFLLDSQDARTELTDLVRRGLVITEGARRWTRYGINPATLSPASEVRLTNAERATLQALADGALGRAELEERLAVSGRAVLLRLDALLDANPPLVTREGKTRSPNTVYGLTEAGRAALQAIDQDT